MILSKLSHHGSSGGTNEKRSRNIREGCFIPGFSPRAGNLKKHKKANMEGPEENNNPRGFIAENAQTVLDDIFVSSDADGEENYNLDSIFISKKLKTILDEVI